MRSRDGTRMQWAKLRTKWQFERTLEKMKRLQLLLHSSGNTSITLRRTVPPNLRHRLPLSAEAEASSRGVRLGRRKYGKVETWILMPS